MPHAVRSPSALALLPLLIACLPPLAGGCKAPPVHTDPRLREHVIRFDADGNTIDPMTGGPPRKKRLRDQFDDVLRKIDRDQAEKNPRKVMLFVHGGLNAPDDNLVDIPRRLDVLRRLAPDVHPIYVVWESDLVATYKEHLFAVRQGRKDSVTKSAAGVSWPVYLITDLLRSAARAPTVWLQQRATDDQAAAAALDAMFSGKDEDPGDSRGGAATPPAASADRAATASRSPEAWMNHPRNDKTLAFYNVLYEKYARDVATNGKQTNEIAVSIGPDHSRASDWVGRGAFYLLTFPSKVLTSPLIDAFGSAGWRMMSRRTQTIVEGASDFELTGTDADDAAVRRHVHGGTRGGLDYFLERLDEHAAWWERERGVRYEVTLVGHSMGTMVLNEALRRQLAREADNAGRDGAHVLPVKNVVYLAAACSIRDFVDSVIPYMRQKKHDKLRFFNLCLHPTAEMIESNVYDLPPRGSLLCWIDDFLSDPATPLDRTLGRWENVMTVPYVFPQALRARIAIKAFDLKRDGEAWHDEGEPWRSQPQQHGQFGAAGYWDERFWTPDPPTAADQQRIRDAAARRAAKNAAERRQRPQQQQQQQQQPEESP